MAKIMYDHIEKEPVECRLARAKDPETDPELLRRLSKDEFWFVRDFVASNPSTPRECLEELLQDDDFRIRGDAEKTLTKKSGLDAIIASAAAHSFQQDQSKELSMER